MTETTLVGAVKGPVNGTLTQKGKELVAVGASIAAGCRPCTAYHFRAARAAGASEEEIRRAVDAALCVRNSTAKIMAGLAEKHLGGALASDTPCCSEKPLIGELVSVSAAFAVNCVANLETHLASARRLGATKRQIETTLEIARMVKKVAAQKVEAAVEMAAAAPATASDGCADDCGCGAGKVDEAANAAPAPCGCEQLTAALSAASQTADCGCEQPAAVTAPAAS